MHKTDACCTLVPYFQINDGQVEAFKALGPQFVARTRTEPGCVHYAFSYNGSQAHCREGYDNAEAVPETIHVQVKPDGSITVPEWRRTYVRCKGFQSRS